MVRSLTVSGLMGNQKALESSHGLMVVDTKVSGSKANQLAKALRRIRTDSRKEANGKVVSSLSLAMLMRERIETLWRPQSRLISQKSCQMAYHRRPMNRAASHLLMKKERH